MRSVRRGVLRCCAVARWVRAVPRGSPSLALPRAVRLGAVVPVPSLGGLRSSPRPFGARSVCSSGRGRSGFSVLDPTRSVRRALDLLKSIGVCGQRFPPTPSRSSASARGGWSNPFPADGGQPEVGAPSGARGTAHPRPARAGTSTSSRRNLGRERGRVSFRDLLRGKAGGGNRTDRGVGRGSERAGTDGAGGWDFARVSPARGAAAPRGRDPFRPGGGDNPPAGAGKGGRPGQRGDGGR